MSSYGKGFISNPTPPPAAPASHGGDEEFEFYECSRCGGDVPILEAVWDVRLNVARGGPWCSYDCPGTGGEQSPPAAPVPISEEKASSDAYRSAAPAWKAGDEVYVTNPASALGGEWWPDEIASVEKSRVVLESGDTANFDEIAPRRAVDDWQRVRDALERLGTLERAVWSLLDNSEHRVAQGEIVIDASSADFAELNALLPVGRPLATGALLREVYGDE